MKKIIVFLAAVFLSSISLFAEPSAKYKELLAKAKQYEQDKKYYFALGTYYDAVAAEQTPEAKEAYDSFIALEKMIKAGNPGYETKDEFEMHDSWKALIKEFESYWSKSENIPIQFYISDIKKVSVNFDTRTTNYEVYIGWDYTPKYRKLRYVFTDGYLKSYRSDWTDLPRTYNDIFSSLWPESRASVDESNFPASGERDGALYEYFAWQYVENGGKHYSGRSGDIRIAALQGQNYELTVSFVDENGTAVLSEKHSPEKRSIYKIAGDGLVKAEANYFVTFKNVPQSITAKINSGEVKAKVTGVSLEYGIYHDGIDRRHKKTLDISKIMFVPFDPAKKTEYKEPISNYEVIAAETDFTTLLSDLNNEMVMVHGCPYKIQSAKVSQKLYLAATGGFIKNYNAASPVKVKYYNAIIFCNMLSIKAGLNPVYSVNGETDVSKWNIDTTQLSRNQALIELIEGCNGFRLPSADEALYINDMEDEVESFVAQYNNLKKSIWTYRPDNNEIYYDKEKEIVLVQNLSESELKNLSESELKSEPKSELKSESKSELKSESNNLSESESNDVVKKEVIGIMVKVSDKLEVGATEVTQKQYQEIMGKNPSNSKGDYLPVENVSWIDAIEFCNKLSEKEGLQKCYSNGRWVYYNVKTGEEVTKEKYDKDHKKVKDEYKFDKYYTADCNQNANGYRLPTAEEWYSFAPEVYNGLSRYLTAEEFGWVNNNSKGSTHQVAAKTSDKDVYDMIGNVAEWCNDQGGYNSFQIMGITDDKIYEHAYRGSSYLDSGEIIIRKADVHFYSTDGKSSKIGFRVVRTVK